MTSFPNDHWHASGRFAKRGEFVLREIAGETIVVPIRSRTGDLDAIYVLDAVGTLIWRGLDSHPTVDQLVDRVCTKFDVERDVAVHDTLEFLASLQGEGLVESKASPDTQGT